MTNAKKTLLIVVLVIVVGAIAWLEAIKPHEGPTITAQQAALNGVTTATNTAANASSSVQSSTPSSFASASLKNGS